MPGGPIVYGERYAALLVEFGQGVTGSCGDTVG